jgi:hypothetical protein
VAAPSNAVVIRRLDPAAPSGAVPGRPATVVGVDDRPGPRPGEWWYSVRCDKCSRVIHAFRDPSNGDSVIRLDGPGTDYDLACPSCGHRSVYSVMKLKSHRVSP